MRVSKNNKQYGLEMTKCSCYAEDTCGIAVTCAMQLHCVFIQVYLLCKAAF